MKFSNLLTGILVGLLITILLVAMTYGFRSNRQAMLAGGLTILVGAFVVAELVKPRTRK